MNKPKQKRPFKISKKMRVAAKIFADGGFLYLQEVADKVGVHRCTLWRWWQRKEFRRYCGQVRQRAVAQAWKEIRKENRAEAERLRKLCEQLDQEDKEKQERRKRRELERWIKANMPPEEQKKALEQARRMTGAT